MTRLDDPSLTVIPAGGQPLELPSALAGHFGVVLLYRGGWCPYCVGQLRAFRRAADRHRQRLLQRRDRPAHAR